MNFLPSLSFFVLFFLRKSQEKKRKNLESKQSACQMRQQRRQITRGLLQKRAEHNDGIVRTLKEVSLHQEKLERIGESLQRDCRELRILLLHENQIGKLGR